MAIVRATFVTDIGHSLREGFYMFWETLWALVLGFGLSGAVQAFVSRDEMQRRLGDHRPARGRPSVALRGRLVVMLVCRRGDGEVPVRPRARTSSPRWCSCSPRPTWSSSSASCSLVLIGWQFVAAEFVGGAIMIVLLVLAGGLWFRGRALAEAHKVAEASSGDHAHHRSERRNASVSAGALDRVARPVGRTPPATR